MYFIGMSRRNPQSFSNFSCALRDIVDGEQVMI